MLEVAILKGMFMCFNFGNPNFFELVAYTGYKFIVLCIVMFAHVSFGKLVSYGAMVAFGASFCYFFYCTMRRQ